MKTYSTKPSDIKRFWHFVDLGGKILGREATRITYFLMGKNKVYYVPHLDCGDYVVVVNSDRISLTGKKEQQKTYYRHSGYPGGFKTLSFKEQMQRDSRKVVLTAVSKMLPKNKLRQKRLNRLKIFRDDKHPYGGKFKTSEK